MGFLSNIEVTNQAAPVCPEGDYVITCTKAKYLLKDPYMPEEEDNLKGMLCVFEIPFGKSSGQCVKNFNLWNSSPIARDIASAEFTEMAKAMGFESKEGKIIGLDDSFQLVGKKALAHIKIANHWKTEEKENQIAFFIKNDDAELSDTQPYDDDIPF